MLPGGGARQGRLGGLGRAVHALPDLPEGRLARDEDDRSAVGVVGALEAPPVTMTRARSSPKSMNAPAIDVTPGLNLDSIQIPWIEGGMTAKVFGSIQEVVQAADTDLGTPGWVEVDQGRINLFADATGDPVRAANSLE